MSDKPFDLDAVAAEAVAEPFVFTYAGREWSLPPFDSVDKRLLDRMGEGDLEVAVEAMRMSFGEQWAEFDATPMSMHVLNALIAAWGKHSGMDLGEGLASSRS